MCNSLLLFFVQAKQLFHFEFKETGEFDDQNGRWYKFPRLNGVNGFSGHANSQPLQKIIP
jgi:hypothetical protein